MHGLSTLRALNTGRTRINRSIEIDTPRTAASYGTPKRKPRKPKPAKVRWSAKQLGLKDPYRGMK